MWGGVQCCVCEAWGVRACVGCVCGVVCEAWGGACVGCVCAVPCVCVRAVLASTGNPFLALQLSPPETW